MSVEHEHDQAPPEASEADDATQLAPGVWITEATGFASVPPRAQSDLCEVREETRRQGEGEGGRKGDAAREAERNKAADAEPRIERYPER
jgi:hypothetical protein